MSSKLQCSEDPKGFTFSFNQNQLYAEKSKRKFNVPPPEGAAVDTVVFTQLNGKFLDVTTCSHEILFVAEAFLQKHGHAQLEVKVGDKVLGFPAKECLQRLPEIQQDVQLTLELDRYDGPISGFFETAEQFFHFNWCMQAFENEAELFRNSRFFYAREIPGSACAELKKWLKEYEQSSDDQSSLLWESRTIWEQYPITHVWSEAFDEKQDFAAIRIVYKAETDK